MPGRDRTRPGGLITPQKEENARASVTPVGSDDARIDGV
jgi:hypothetical protein